jgi:hypothetical protein
MYIIRGGVMSTSLSDRLRSKNALEIINNLAEYIDKEPFRTMKEEDISSIPEEMRVIMLIADFEAEFAINGIFGFLENSSGLYLDDTIDAYRIIGAVAAAETLVNIRGIMYTYNMSPQRLRENFSDLEEFQIVSSADVHGNEINPMMDDIETEIRRDFYLSKPGDDSISELLIKYIDERKENIYDWSRNYTVS